MEFSQTTGIFTDKLIEVFKDEMRSVFREELKEVSRVMGKVKKKPLWMNYL